MVDLFKRSARSIRSWWIFFSKIDERASIPSIFEKDWRTKMYGSDLLFWHWKGEKLSKTEDKYVFFDGIASFLWSKNQFDSEKDSNHSLQSFLKINRIDLLTVDLFNRLTRAICSRSIFLKDRWERFNHGRPWIKKDPKERKRKDRKIKRSNSQPWRIESCNSSFVYL